jgi:septum formation protein
MPNKKYQLILGSASPRRKELLNYLHIPFEIVTCDIDESSPEQDPIKWVEDVAVKKSEAVMEKLKRNYENVFIITADTIVCHDSKILGKPVDRQDAKAMLQGLSGQEHTVYTAVCLRTKTNTHSFTIGSKVSFTHISEQDLELYLDTGEPMDKAGSYGIQASALTFVDTLEGSYSNVVGLPLSELIKQIKIFLSEKENWRECFVK